MAERERPTDDESLAEWERRRRGLLKKLGAERREARDAGHKQLDQELANVIHDIRGFGVEKMASMLENYKGPDAKSEAGVSNVIKELAKNLHDAPPPANERAKQLRRLLAQPVWPVRFAMYPYEKTGGPLLAEFTVEGLRKKLQAIEDEGPADVHKRETMMRNALVTLGVAWPRTEKSERDGLAWVGFLLLGSTPEEALDRVADRPHRGCKPATISRSVRRFFRETVGIKPPLPVPTPR